MEEKRHYRELPYQRPDVETVAKTLDELAEQVKQATSYEEVKELYETYDNIVSQVRTQAVLVQLRFLCDVTNEFYQKEYVEFTSIADGIILPTNLCAAFLSSKFMNQLTAEYGVILQHQFEESLRMHQGQDLLMQDQMLQNEYQMLVQSLYYTLDGKEITNTELSDMKKSSNQVVREKAHRVIYAAYLEKKEEFERILKSLVKIRNERAVLNGFKNYIELGNCIWGRHDYGEADIEKASATILKYFRPLYDELIKHQQTKISKVSDRNYLLTDKKLQYENLLEACQKMFHQLGKETGEYIDKLIEQEAFDLDYSPYKMPNVAFQNYINDLKIAPVFGNFKNSSSDVYCVVHEFAHSFQEYQSGLSHGSLFNIIPPIDQSEIVSRSMEFYTYEYAHLFYPKDYSKWIYLHAIGVVDYILRFCAENEFENYLYEHEGATLEDITQTYISINQKYLPFTYEGFEEYVLQGADYFMFDSFVSLPKYSIGYVPAYISALELVFHTEKSYETYLDMCRNLGYRRFEETLKIANLKYPFSEEAIMLAEQTLESVIRERSLG